MANESPMVASCQVDIFRFYSSICGEDVNWQLRYTQAVFVFLRKFKE